eukprot:1584277-Amphidinium_carterae.1
MSGLRQAEDFAAQWMGLIKIITPGTYTFSLRSDDGSLLYIDGTQVKQAKQNVRVSGIVSSSHYIMLMIMAMI